MEVKIVDGSNSFLKPKPNQCLVFRTPLIITRLLHTSVKNDA